MPARKRNFSENSLQTSIRAMTATHLLEEIKIDSISLLFAHKKVPFLKPGGDGSNVHRTGFRNRCLGLGYHGACIHCQWFFKQHTGMTRYRGKAKKIET